MGSVNIIPEISSIDQANIILVYHRPYSLSDACGHQAMDMFSALLVYYEGTPPVTGVFQSHIASNAELWNFLLCWPEQAVEKITGMPIIWDDMSPA